jgi:hypothetical protein
MAVSASANVTAIPAASPRTILISPDCNGRNKQRVNAISDQPARQARKKSLFNHAICPQFQRTVNRARLC